MTELEVQLSADIGKLKSELAKANKLVDGFGDKVDKQAVRGGKGFTKVGKGAANALPSLQEFSRVIQDAPFGIQGVGNNIQQLTANFGNLSKSAGGTVPALKLMISSLAGPAGVLLAVSAVTSLLTAYSKEIGGLIGSTNELAKSTGEFVASAQSEITVLRNLVGIAQDENLSKKVRLGAIERINKEYSDYLGNLDLESVKTDGVKASVDALTKSLLKQAQVRGVEALIEKKFADSAEDLVGVQLRQKEAAKAVESEINRLRNTVAAFNNVSKDLPLTEQIEELQNVVNRAGGSGSGQLRVLGSLVGEFNNAVLDTRKFKGDLEKELKPIQDLLSSLTIEDLFNDLSGVDNGVTVVGERIKEGINKFKNEFESLDDIFGIKDSVQKTLDGFRPDFSNFNTKFSKLGDVIEFSLKDSVSRMKPQLAEMERLMLEFNETATNIINNGIIDAFSSIGRGIGNAIANGTNVFSEVGLGLLKVVGQVATQLGEAAIGIGVAMLAIKLSFTNPFTAIAAGVALVALGSALGGIANNALQAQGSSGSAAVAGQGSVGTGSNFSSNAGGFSSSSSGGEFVFRIRGRELVGVLENELSANRRLGGVGSVIGA